MGAHRADHSEKAITQLEHRITAAHEAPCPHCGDFGVFVESVMLADVYRCAPCQKRYVVRNADRFDTAMAKKERKKS